MSYSYIVKNAEGWMRNAVSLFEQLIHNNAIEYSHIVETLWIASDDEKQNFLLKLKNADTSLLDDFKEMLSEWKNMKNFCKSLLDSLRVSAIAELSAGKDATKEIILLDRLHDILMKTKNSFDENLTIEIGLLKILWRIDNNSIIASSSQVPEQKSKPAQVQPQEVKNNTSSQISTPTEVHPDIVEDIFALHEPEIASGDNSSQNTIDSDELIKTVKKHGWKAALTMSIKWSMISLENNILVIQTKTKISAATIEKTENRDYIMQALSEMWIQVSDIKIV